MATSPQRSYRAACPGCGAPVEFRSAQSTHAVCGYCQSTVVREGDKLARLGKMAEVFEDYSPLQLMAEGRWEGKVFTLVGRLQYRGSQGNWTEWNALFDDGQTAVLSEDNGNYVLSFPFEVRDEVPHFDVLRVGALTRVDGKTYTVSALDEPALASAQGELPKLPPLGTKAPLAELRNEQGEVLSIDYRRYPPTLDQGRSVRLEDFAFKGLREESAKDEKGRQFNCPHCGSPVSVKLATSKSITCGACNAIIDLSQGTGGELAHALQDEPVQALIPLGSLGELQGTKWQVVGFQHRMGHDPEDADEHFGWSEYLLYNREKGFCFLVDSEEGWSLARPVTGAPRYSGGDSAQYLGQSYLRKYAYQAETSYVCGEFYWPVARGQTTENIDFASKNAVLSMERTGHEMVWSLGSRLDSAVVAKAFGLEKQAPLLQRDAAPAASSGLSLKTIVLIVVVIVVLLVILQSCEEQNSGSGYTSSGSSGRVGGGSYGGYSSGGGGHK